MSEKALLTQDQAKAIEELRDVREAPNTLDWILRKQLSKGWEKDNSFRVLNELSTGDFLNALHGFYDVEKTPQFEPGDLAIFNGRFITLDKWIPEQTAWNYDGTGFIAFVGSLKKPTPDEIFWLHDLKRDCVNDFRVGDLIETKEGELFYVAFGDARTKNQCTYNDAERFAKEGNIKAIFPFESLKPYRKEEN